MSSFCISISGEPTAEQMEVFQKMIDVSNKAANEEIAQLAVELSVCEATAMDVWYLRTRSRHTPELEKELIRLHEAGTPPNICEFGCGRCS